MRSRLLLLGKPNNKAYAFRSIPGGARAIKSGCTRKKYEELTESLIRANPNSAGVFESHGETNAHDLIRIKNTPCSPLHSQKANPTITYCSYTYALRTPAFTCIGPSFWLLICVLNPIGYKHTQFI